MITHYLRIPFLNLYLVSLLMLLGCNSSNGQKKPAENKKNKKDTTALAQAPQPAPPPSPPAPPAVLDTALYNKAVMHLLNDSPKLGWPPKTPYPLPGAILPFKRIIAYYGNFYSTKMGILGELPPDEMLKKFAGEVKKWEQADPQTPVMPAIHYIAVTAQGAPGKSGMYRARMPFTQIDKALELAKRINGIVFLDVQVALSTLQQEIPLLDTYLAMPQVHLAIDPEFSMKSGKKPGTVIGTFDAADINYVTNHLTELVKKHNLPPKVFVIHRFTNGMMTNYKNIKTPPEVQLVIHMDGWGFPAKKVNSYKLAVVREPVQFAGFKLFYKNDIKTPPWKTIMTPEEVLKKLYPKPIYIQYQ
ncbi:MAG: hypothetical protein K0Q79_2541 [Flavipsychrobacter sp.]|nr:hypothetical protein [Flavipsychrobacter sp.]